MAKLSDTALTILNKAAQHDGGLLVMAKMNAPQQNVTRSLLKQSLLIELPWKLALGVEPWRDSDDGMFVLKITDDGFRALGIPTHADDDGQPEPDCSGIEGSVPNGPGAAETQAEALAVAAALEAGQGANVGATRASLKDAAQAVVNAWTAIETRDPKDFADERRRDEKMRTSMDALRAAMAKPARPERPAREPRGDSKQEQVIAMLRQPDGATNPAIQEATGWAPHTVRGFFAGLKKKGHTILANKVDGTTVYSIPG